MHKLYLNESRIIVKYFQMSDEKKLSFDEFSNIAEYVSKRVSEDYPNVEVVNSLSRSGVLNFCGINSNYFSVVLDDILLIDSLPVSLIEKYLREQEIDKCSKYVKEYLNLKQDNRKEKYKMNYTVKDFRIVPDFPKEGIQFVDITPILNDGEKFKESIDAMCRVIAGEDRSRSHETDVIVGIESRGFIFGAAVAAALGKRFVPVRKPGKLPYETNSVKYGLEYGESELHIHKDAIKNGDRVVIIDDLLATGGSACAAIDLVEGLGGIVNECIFFAELKDIGGKKVIDNKGVCVTSMNVFTDEELSFVNYCKDNRDVLAKCKKCEKFKDCFDLV